MTEKKKLKIDIVSMGGSPSFVTEQSIYGIDGRPGVGGAELGILTLCRLWHNAGHDVTFYNEAQNGRSEFRHASIREFRRHAERDILVIFRTPLSAELLQGVKGKKVWYSNDQFTVGDFQDFSKRVDKIVVISKFHQEYFKMMYGIFDTTIIDIPLRTWEYPVNPEKKKNSCIFTSVPDRGLLALAPIWDRIIEKVPDATLTITGDWSLWEGNDVTEELRKYKMAFAGKKGITYRSAVRREELIKIQSEAEFHLYPCLYDELFCISVAESQIAGVYPITSTNGAVGTTNRLGKLIGGHPISPAFVDRFVETTVELMNSPRPLENIQEKALQVFDNQKVLEAWDKIFYED